MKRIAMICVAAAVLTGCNANRSGYDAEGYFESTEVTVSAESSGKILYFNAEEGADVEAGTLLGCIDTVQLYLTRMQLAKSAESVLKNRPDIAKQVQAMKEQLKTLEREKDRVARLLADGAATQKQMDDIESQISVMEVQLDAQETALENSVSSLDAQSSSIGMQIAQIDDKLAKCRISSPVSGTVLTKYAEAGEFVAAGRPLFKEGGRPGQGLSEGLCDICAAVRDKDRAAGQGLFRLRERIFQGVSRHRDMDFFTE